MAKKRPTILVILMIATVAFASTQLFQLSVTGGLLSISNIIVEVENPDDPGTEEYEGGWWVISALTDTTFGFQTYTFDQTESEKSYADPNAPDGTELVPTAGVKIKIIPQQPYYEVALQYHPDQLVTPKTYGTYMAKIGGAPYGKMPDTYVAERKVSYWTLEGTWGWQLHTPFRVELYKNGVMLDHEEFDTEGKSLTKWLQNPSDSTEKMSVTDLGKIEGGENPPVNDELIIFSKEHIYTGNIGQLQDDIEYDKASTSYSNYWFNPTSGEGASQWSRWADDNSPTHFYYYRTLKPNAEIGAEPYDDVWNYRVKPVRPNIFADTPNTTPYGLSLVNYLIQKRGMEKINFYNLDYVQKIEIVNSHLKLYKPRGSASSLIKIEMSTELCDTIAVSMGIAIPEITDVKWLSTQTTESEIGDKDTVKVTVKNIASVEGTIGVRATKTPSGAPVSFDPADQMDIPAGASHTFDFQVLCLGAAEDTPFSITFTAEDSGGTPKSTATVTGVQLKRGEATATLTVYTTAESTGEPVSGIYVTVYWDSQSTGQYTSGGSTTFDMESLQQTVTVLTSETEIYKSATASVEILSGVENSVELKLIRKDAPPPPIDWMFLLLLVPLMLTPVAYYMYKKRKKW